MEVESQAEHFTKFFNGLQKIKEGAGQWRQGSIGKQYFRWKDGKWGDLADIIHQEQR